MPDKIDSNATGLRFAEEASIRVLPGSPVFYGLEPNSYADFGGQIATVARNPINPGRQDKKGVTSDLDASGGFNQDLTSTGLTRLLQGFFFADIREKKTTAPMNAAAVVVTSATASTDIYAAASGMLGFLANNLIFATGFTNAANNGLKLAASASTATALTVSDGLVDEPAPPAGASLRTVGYQFANATLNVVLNGNLVRLSRASGAFDFTTLGLAVGEWIFVGGDSAGFQFTNNLGFARVLSVSATIIELDKVGWTPQAETGTGKTIQIFFGDYLRNENNPALIKRRTYHLERTLGTDGVGTMSEYLVGAVANEMTLNIAQADKVTVDMGFVALDNEQRTGTQGLKAGTRPALVSGDAFNTSSDFSRIKLALFNGTNANPIPLFAFATELSLTLTNNANPSKGVGILGAFDISYGNFQVSGSMTAYFADVTAVQAVRDNSNVTLDIAMVKDQAGFVFDVPLLSLGGGRLTVEKDQPIMIPLETMAAEGAGGYTLSLGVFSYLPLIAG